MLNGHLLSMEKYHLGFLPVFFLLLIFKIVILLLAYVCVSPLEYLKVDSIHFIIYSSVSLLGIFICSTNMPCSNTYYPCPLYPLCICYLPVNYLLVVISDRLLYLCSNNPYSTYQPRSAIVTIPTVQIYPKDPLIVSLK